MAIWGHAGRARHRGPGLGEKSASGCGSRFDLWRAHGAAVDDVLWETPRRRVCNADCSSVGRMATLRSDELPQSLDIANIAQQVRDAFERHIVFHSDYASAESGTLALWTLHTHLFPLGLFEATPYLMITAPTSEAGKSQVFKVARRLVRAPFVVVDPSPAAIFRGIDGRQPTLLIDESDLLVESKQLKMILNSGFEPGTPVARAGKEYSTYCPKAFSGIAGDRQPLTNSTLSRCIQIPMRRKASHERFEPLNPSAVADLDALQEKIEAWALAASAESLRCWPTVPDGLTSRQEDTWRPLLGIADLVGWGKPAREWAIVLTDAIPKMPDVGVQILADMRRVLEERFPGQTWVPTKALTAERNNLDGRQYDDDLTPNQLGRRLAGFGIHRDSSPRRQGGRAAPVERGFIIRSGGKLAKAWQDAFERYDV